MTDGPVPPEMGQSRLPTISAVVPTHDAAATIERLDASIRAQTLEQSEIEVIYCDDGSIDDTPERLDRIAAAHPNTRVLHLMPSGWPCRPRNAGMDAFTALFQRQQQRCLVSKTTFPASDRLAATAAPSPLSLTVG